MHDGGAKFKTMNSYANKAVWGTWQGQLLTDFEEGRCVFPSCIFNSNVSEISQINDTKNG